MSRKKNRQSIQQQGNFVPASQNRSVGRASHGRSSQSFDSMPLTYADAMNQYSRSSADYSNRKHSSGRSKKPLAIIMILLVVAIGVLGFFVFKEYQKSLVNQDLHGGMTQAELEALDNELTGMTTFDEPFTVLLLGSDARSDDPSMGARTDTIVLVRVDPTTNNITMLSIPRDTRINIPGVGYEKFNAAFTYGGPSGTIAAVKELCGVDIDHYAEINFEGLVGLIDAIGGIDVHVDEMINDPDAGNVVIPEGDQHLDGAAALTFSRSRAFVDGDFTRVSNQRKVIEAIVHRGLEAPATELYGIIQSCTGFLTTDSGMDVDFIYSLADQIRHNNDYPVTLTTATIPSYAQSLYEGGMEVSYVLVEEDGLQQVMKVFMEGGDVQHAVDLYYGRVTEDENTTGEDGAGSGASAAGDGSSVSSGYGSQDYSTTGQQQFANESASF